MPRRYQDIQWIIQQNLTNTADLEQLKTACNNIGVRHQEVMVIPFTEALPEFDRSYRSIFYGSVTFSQMALAEPSVSSGLFMDNTIFSIENYFERWGRHMLNYGAMLTTFEALVQMDLPADKLYFIRPDNDHKSFAGEVKSFGDIGIWYEQLKATDISLDSRIVVSEPYNIRYEWRLWIVHKKVVAASKYREYFQLTKERGCPEEVIHYAEARCREYTPHDVFVMDVCRCGDEYFIVECGCMNSAGFYAADIAAIVAAVTDYFADKK
ncbi:ATP-grasp domain-containing protein [Chitinophaga sp. G-6-1-13]|uniref:ATP-grasp domain-containing protein n=1 Tax=Chitinophaga fulva TaxID=2728842 RepID=A0A848GWD3_9BACT|nr:ATP-grasp domain-containing protein [Chitinophaga fulva]NML41522.1 ATP-grasp domain-containing protein [Chitinophaga fulva]